MCLYISQAETGIVRKNLSEHQDLIFYKVYEKKKDGLYAYCMCGKLPVRLRANMEIVSNRKTKRLTRLEQRHLEVHKGIHVFTNLSAANDYFRVSFKDKKVTTVNDFGRKLVLVKVTAKGNDLVRAGGCEAVFMKVKVHPSSLYLFKKNQNFWAKKRKVEVK